MKTKRQQDTKNNKIKIIVTALKKKGIFWMSSRISIGQAYMIWTNWFRSLTHDTPSIQRLPMVQMSLR